MLIEKIHVHFTLFLIKKTLYKKTVNTSGVVNGFFDKSKKCIKGFMHQYWHK